MCLFYCSIAAFTSYYLLTFWRLAPGTRNPALTAPLGRMLDSGIVLLSGAIHLSSFPATVVLSADIAGVAAVIVLMSINGDFSFSAFPSDQTAGSDAPGISQDAADTADLPRTPLQSGIRSEEEALILMQEKYSLTRRETEVLAQLVLSEDKQSVISDRLSISVKTLQDYVTRLYRKTGAKTRSGLTELYHKARIHTSDDS